MLKPCRHRFTFRYRDGGGLKNTTSQVAELRAFGDPHTQILTGLEQLVMLTRVTLAKRTTQQKR
jgi:hypothetical protein